MRIKRLGAEGRRMESQMRFLPRSEVERPDRAAWRAWYKTARWQRLRWSVLVAADFRCARCGYQSPLGAQAEVLNAVGLGELVEGRAPDMVADHIVAHRGDEVRFWAAGNLQCLCAKCHNRDKQREERRGGVGQSLRPPTA